MSDEQQQGYEELEAEAAETKRLEELELEELRAREAGEEATYEEMGQNLEAQDIEYANRLATVQESNSISKLARDLYDRGMAFSSPSMFKWGVIFSLAVVNDAVDLLDLTGIGAILSWIISLGLTALILLIIWFTDGGLKGAQEYASNVKGTVEQVQYIESNVKKLTEGVAGRLKKIPGFKNIKVRETARKSPLARALMGSAAESIPFLGAVNLITVWVFFAYLAEKHAYKIARDTAEETYAQISGTASEMV